MNGGAHQEAGEISRSRFDRVIRDYHPLPFEDEGFVDHRFRTRMHHVLKNRGRLWAAIQAASRFFPSAPFTAVDLGTYPGSLLRLLDCLIPSDRCRLVGAGLMTGNGFAEAMASDCGAETLTVNLDPLNDQLQAKGYPTRIPLRDGSAEMVFCLEVVEHLVSPSHLLAEASRICAPGGHVVLTTPNVSRIGNVFKLLLGRSNFDRLVRPGYVNPDDEWRPHFREYTMTEVSDLLGRAGLRVVASRHFVDADTRYNVKTVSERITDLAKLPFYFVPHFREGLLLVARKPGRADSTAR